MGHVIITINHNIFKNSPLQLKIKFMTSMDLYNLISVKIKNDKQMGISTMQSN